MSRQTNYLLRKSGIFSQWSSSSIGGPVSHLTIVSTGAKFALAKGVLYNDILRLKGLLLDQIAPIIPSHVGTGKDISVAADSALSGTLESNPHGTELGLVTAIAKSLEYGGFWFEYIEDFLKDIYKCWGECCQNSCSFSATDLTDDHEHARR